MKMKRGNKIGLVLIVVLIISVSFVIAQDFTFNVCCEKTKNGAWCQNTLEENCDSSYRDTPTSCEATSFCKKGCCVDTEEGLCMENTPQKVCEESTGTWFDDAECNIAQCNLGCCILGDQASFVTLTRCKRLSGLYGLETNFRRNINDEAQCILMAHFQDKGACVYESEGERTCKFTTREECLNKKEGGNVTLQGEFFKGYLCSADELATDCGPTKETTCVDGKDEVYFIDSCGNPANIYDANRIYDKDPSYWQKVFSKSESCGVNSPNGNAGSKICGNCEYFRGSICAEGKTDVTYGDYVCRDLNCYNTENGNDYKNGESWCVYQGVVGKGEDLVGSRHFRHVCINGEETIEPCSDFRSEICIQDKIETSDGDFLEAGCRINRWHDCIDQDEEKDCLNTDKRDCYWTEGLHFGEEITERSAEESSTTIFSGGTTGAAIFGGDDEESTDAQPSGVQMGGNACLPNVPPGLKFWSQGDAQGICSLGNSVCVVEYEEKLWGDKECKENCECLEQGWVEQMNSLCTNLGDCGAYKNIAGKYTDDGVEWKIQGKKKVIEGVLGKIKQKAKK